MLRACLAVAAIGALGACSPSAGNLVDGRIETIDAHIIALDANPSLPDGTITPADATPLPSDAMFVADAHVNRAPVANALSVITNEDTATSVTLVATDADGDQLTYSVVASPTNGTLSGTAPNLTYTPGSNFHGADSFTFKANDGTVDSNIATVTLTVNFVNHAPVAATQIVTLDENVATAITLGATDSDGDNLAYSVVEAPSHGTLSGTAPNLTYTPGSNFHGADSFTFKANDGTVDSNTATVTLTVTFVDHAPTASPQNVSTNENNATSVTVNATDVDGDSLSYAIVDMPTHGVLSGTLPNLTYTPDVNYVGDDSFTFSANDGTLDSTAATVSITVLSGTHIAPVATSQTIAVDENSSVEVSLSATDEAGDTLTYGVADEPTNGSLSGIPPDLTYTPNPNFHGADSFTFTANDGVVDSNPATISITVNFVDSAPVAVPQTVSLFANTSATVTLSATDIDGDSLTYAIASAPAHGSLSGTAPNLTYTPSTGYNGNDSFSFTANDGTLTSSAATVSITVQADPTLTGLSLNVSGSSMLQTPTVTATVIAANAPTTNFYVSSSATPDCSGGSLGSTNATSISLQLASVGAAGPKFIHYLAFDTNPANTNGCTFTGLHYDYVDAPLLAFSQSTYAIKESDGTTVLSTTGVRVTRTDGNGNSVTGATSSVTLTPSTVVARAGFASAPIAVNFSAGDTFVDLAASNFSITNNATIEQDSYFKVALSAPSGGVVDLRSQAKVFIIDDETAGDLMFADTLFTANQSSGTATVRMWRTGSTASAATATLNVRDGSALGNTDYSKTATVVTFAVGQSEVTQTIAIVDHNSTSAPSTSFYVSLDSPSTSTRPQSIAKVRILNDRDTTACNASNLDGSVNSGFGGGSGTAVDPFLICSSAQFSNMQNFLTSDFKMTADIDASAVMASTALFSGQLDGNEHLVDNVSQSTSAAAAGALFGTLTGSANVTNVNVDNFAMTCSAHACGGLFDVINNSATDNISFSNLYVSGFLRAIGAADNGLIAGATGASDPTKTLTIANIFTAGTLSSTQGFGAPLIGILTPSGSSNISNVMNIAIVSSTGNDIGGVIGSSTAAASTNLTLTKMENRGFISCMSNCAGISGEVHLLTSSTANITNLTNHGTMTCASGGSTFAGILGDIQFAGGVNFTVDTLTNTGNLTDTAQALSYQAGIIGHLRPTVNPAANVVGTMTHFTNSGNISALGDYNGGIIGAAPDGAGDTITNSTFTFSSWNNSGSVTTTDFDGSGSTGGLVGYIGGNWNSFNSGTSFTFTDVVNSGAVTENQSGQNYTGGFFGALFIDGSSVVVKGNSFNSGNVTGSSATDAVGGWVGEVIFNSGASFSLTTTASSAVTSAVTVSGRNMIGGVVGMIGGLSSNNMPNDSVSITSIRSDATVTGASSASNYGGGIVGALFSGGTGANFSLTMSSLTNTGTIRQGNFVGGIIGDLSVPGTSGNTSTSTLSSLTSSGNVETYSKAALASSSGIGGLIGNMGGGNFSTVTLSNSSATGNVNSLAQTDVGLMGGLVGLTGCGAVSSCSRSISKSFATGNVIAAQHGGGFIGDYFNCSGTNMCTLSIAQSFSTGTVTDNFGSTFFGGFIGCIINPANASFGNLNITNSYSTSPVVSVTGGSDYGAFIGRIQGVGIANVSTSYAFGAMSGPVAGNGFIQTNDGTLNATNTYSLNSNPSSSFATPLTASAFVDAVNYATNFVGFDFTVAPIWNPPNGTNPPTLH